MIVCIWALYNVTSRLKKFYGDEVSIIINSLENCGFEILILRLI